MSYISMILIGFLILLFLGVPIVYSLGVPLLFYAFLNSAAVPITMVGHTTVVPLISFTLLALPAFLLSGRIMNEVGVTDRLLDFAVAMVGRFRGGLAYANCLASMFFASMSGTAVGDAGGLGVIEIKMMTEAGFKRDFSAGITAASSILGPIIPPSAAMVLLGSIAGMSVGNLFVAGIIPGIIMAGALMVSIFIRGHTTAEGKSWPITKKSLKESLRTIPRVILPMMAPAIIIGGISAGVVTPTEAAVAAIDYSIILGIFYRKVTLKSIWRAMEGAVETSGAFLYIMAVAGFFSWALTREGLSLALQNFLGGLAGISNTGMLLVLGAILLVIGCFLDTSAACILVTPILMPVVTALNIDPIHFGIIMIVGLMIGIITPPFGICLFVVADVAQTTVKGVTREAVRYLPAMVITLVLVIFFPKICLWLPSIMRG